MNWDPANATSYFHSCGSLLVLNIPIHTSFSIDYHHFKTGMKFKGIKLIPKGIHLISTEITESKSKTLVDRNNVSERSNYMKSPISFFINIEPGQVIVKEWDSYLEILKDLEDEEQAERYALSLKNYEFDSYLGAYPIENWKKWLNLTSYLNYNIISIIQPLNKYIYDSNNNIEYNDHIIGNGKYFFTDIDIVNKNLSINEISLYHTDGYYKLRDILAKTYKNENNGFIGEYQFSFVCFLVGQSLNAFEHWKKITNLFCTCFKFIPILVQFIHAFGAMLEELPKDFFIDPISGDSFLKRSLQSIFSSELNDEPENYTRAKLNLESMVESRFGWKRNQNIFIDEKTGVLTNDFDDEAPVVVTDEEFI